MHPHSVEALASSLALLDRRVDLLKTRLDMVERRFVEDLARRLARSALFRPSPAFAAAVTHSGADAKHGTGSIMEVAAVESRVEECVFEDGVSPWEEALDAEASGVHDSARQEKSTLNDVEHVIFQMAREVSGLANLVSPRSKGSNEQPRSLPGRTDHPDSSQQRMDTMSELGSAVRVPSGPREASGLSNLVSPRSKNSNERPGSRLGRTDDLDSSRQKEDTKSELGSAVWVPDLLDEPGLPNLEALVCKKGSGGSFDSRSSISYQNSTKPTTVTVSEGSVVDLASDCISHAAVSEPTRSKVYMHSGRDRTSSSRKGNSSRSFLQRSLKRLLTSDTFYEEWVSKKFDEANTVKVKESVWDLALFLFFEPLGVVTNFMVVVSLALNGFLQLLFTLLIAGFIANSNEDLDVLAEDFRGWRGFASEEVQTMVCQSSFVLGSDFKQLDTYITFHEYTGLGGFGSPGLMLCLGVSATWTLTVLKVLGEVLDEVKALCHLSCKDCATMEIEVSPTGFVLERVPRFRLRFFALMSCAQVAIACNLLVTGLLWLVSTTSIVDLILNGVALSYIMDIDEVIYKVLVPTKLDTLIRRLDPMFIDWSMEMPVRGLFLTVPFVLVMVLVYVILLQPHTEDMLAVQRVLCP